MPPNLQARFRFNLLRSWPNQFAKFCSLKSADPLEKSPDKGVVITYLVNTCGLSPKDAIAASKRVHFDTPDKPNAVLDLLLKHGFTKPQISRIVRAHPRFLLSKPQKSVLPKIDFFLRTFPSVSKKDMITAVSKHPVILTTSLERKLAPNLNYLTNLIGSGKAAALLTRGSALLSRYDLQNRVIPNANHLREIGVPTSCLELSLFYCPGFFSLEPARFRKLVEEVRGMGFDPLKSVFVLAMHARSGKACLSLWNHCYQVYQKWGWSKDDIEAAFRKHPNCMLCSEKKITAVLEFVARELGQDPRLVAKCPTIIFFSMEKRIIPRCTLIRGLASKGLVKKKWKLNTVLGIREKDFVERYVTKFANEAPELCETYTSRKARAGEYLGFVKLMYKK